MNVRTAPAVPRAAARAPVQVWREVAESRVWTFFEFHCPHCRCRAAGTVRGESRQARVRCGTCNGRVEVDEPVTGVAAV